MKYLRILQALAVTFGLATVTFAQTGNITGLTSFTGTTAKKPITITAPTAGHLPFFTGVPSAPIATRALTAADILSGVISSARLPTTMIGTDSLFDAAGDLIVGSGSNTAVRLPKGLPLYVLRVNAAGTGLEWAAVAGGGDAILGGPANFSELTITDFIEASGKNLSIGDVTLGTVINYTDNIKQVFNPGATFAGFNPGSLAGNPSTLADGDIWYNSTTGAIMGRAGGVSIDLGATGGGGGTTLTIADLAGSTTLAANYWYHDTLSLNRTMDDIDLIGVDGSKIIWTFAVTGATRSVNFHTNSTVWRIGEVNAVTSVINFPVGNHHIKLDKIGGKWWLTDSGIITESARAFSFAVSDEITALTVGTKLTWRAPFACTIVSVYADLTSSSSSGLPTFDINKNGASILSTPLTVDVGETDSATAAAAAVISNTSLAARDRLTFDIDVTGTGATGAKITIVYTQP